MIEDVHEAGIAEAAQCHRCKRWTFSSSHLCNNAAAHLMDSRHKSTTSDEPSRRRWGDQMSINSAISLL